MKAVILDALGSLPRYGDSPEPCAESDETLVTVEAASIKQLDRAIALGKHYSSPKTLPIVCGTDGVGRLDDGTRVYFAVNRPPFGAMAERAPAAWTVPLPDGLDSALACAIVNPGLAAWLPLLWRGRLQRGETVMILGATGASGRTAVKAARLLGAGRVIAAGRNQQVLAALGADSTIDLRHSLDELRTMFAAEAERGLALIVDFVWGPATEILIEVLTRHDLSSERADIRLVSVGAMAAPTINLPSAALRGSQLSIIGSGTANFPPVPEMKRIVREILDYAASGALPLDVERVPLRTVTEAWARTGETERRLVLMA